MQAKSAKVQEDYKPIAPETKPAKPETVKPKTGEKPSETHPKPEKQVPHAEKPKVHDARPASGQPAHIKHEIPTKEKQDSEKDHKPDYAEAIAKQAEHIEKPRVKKEKKPREQKPESAPSPEA